MALIPGALYKFKYGCSIDTGGNIIHTGIFIKEAKYTGYNQKFYVFTWDSSPQTDLVSKYITYKMDTSPTLAKQVARGLCDRIPEDCAGIIERMLVGDSVVGKGPDRYPER